MKRFAKASESPVELHVIARNPATRIQIVSESRKICLPEAATGEAKVALPPGQYHVLHWLRTSPVKRVAVDLQEQTVITLERGPRSPADFPTEWNDTRSRSFHSTEVLLPHRLLTLRTEILEPRSRSDSPRGVDTSDNWPTLFLGYAGLPPSPVPLVAPNDVVLVLGARFDESRFELVIVGQTAKKRVGLRRTVPIPDGCSAFVHLTRAPADAVESTRSALIRDWRVARYGLQLRDLTEKPSKSPDEVEDGEALISRLGEPGRVSIPRNRLDRKAGRINVLSSVAEWLLAARSLEWGTPAAQYEATPLFEAIPADGPITDLPDVQLLQLMSALSLEGGRAESTSYKKPFHLVTPVFSETWRALSRVPVGNWRRRPVLIDSTALRAAQSASVGGVWFSWQTPFDPDAPEPNSEQYDLTAAIDEALRLSSALAETVRSSLDQPEDSDRYFTHLVRWDSRSPLERQILNYLTAPIRQEGDDADDAKILEALSAEFGMPLPVIADAVANISRGEDNTNSPLRNPVDSPSSAIEKEPEYEREYANA